MPLEPTIKEALHAAAESERRSLANMLEVAILAYCAEKNIAVQPSVKVKKSK